MHTRRGNWSRGGLVERVRIRRHCGPLCSKLIATVSGSNLHRCRKCQRRRHHYQWANGHMHIHEFFLHTFSDIHVFTNISISCPHQSQAVRIPVALRGRTRRFMWIHNIYIYKIGLGLGLTGFNPNKVYMLYNYPSIYLQHPHQSQSVHALAVPRSRTRRFRRTHN